MVCQIDTTHLLVSYVVYFSSKEFLKDKFEDTEYVTKILKKVLRKIENHLILFSNQEFFLACWYLTSLYYCQAQPAQFQSSFS